MFGCRTRVTALLLAGFLSFTVTAAAKRTPLTFLSWPETGGVEKDALDRSIAQFGKDNPDIEVRVVTAAPIGVYTDKVMAMYAAGMPPDVLFVSQDSYAEWAMRRMLMDITPLYKRDKELTRPGFLFQPQEDVRMFVEGKTYGIGCGWGAYWTYLNASVWQRAGVPLPASDPDACWSFDEFRAAAKKLQQGTVDKPTVSAVEPGLNWWLGVFSWLYGVDEVFNNKRTEFALSSEPRLEDALRKLVDLTTRQNVVPTSMANRWEALSKGKLAMAMAGSWELGFRAPMMQKAKTDMALAPLPTLGVKAGVMLQGHIHCISRTTKHPSEAWRLLKWLSGSEHQRGMVEVGVWPPGRGNLTTSEEMRRWMRPGVHPMGYPDVGVKYIMKYGKALYSPPGFGQAVSYWLPAMEPVFRGQKDLKSVLPGLIKQMNASLALGRKRVGAG